MIDDGVKGIAVRPFRKTEANVQHDEGDGSLCLPVEQKGTVAHQDAEVLDADVLQSEEGSCEVSVVKRGLVVRFTRALGRRLSDENADFVCRVAAVLEIKVLGRCK